MDSFVYFGDALKALDENGKVGGYLVRFSDATKKDLSGEYFTGETYLGAREGDGVDTVFHHGQPLAIKAKLSEETAKRIDGFRDHLFAPVKAKRDAVGIFAETVLNMADEYEKAVFGLVKAGKLGWSSGAVGHLVKKGPDGKITRWPIGEASITPTPCEPLNRAIPIKSLDAVKFTPLTDDESEETPPSAADVFVGLAAKLNQHIDDMVDDGRTRAVIVQRLANEAGVEVKAVQEILDGKNTKPSDAKLRAFSRVLEIDFASLKAKVRHEYLQTIKGMFEEAMADQTPSRWELESIYCKIIKRLANAASAAKLAGVEFDLEAKVREATDEYTGLLYKHAIGQITDWIAEGGDDEFYLKAIIDTAESVKALSAADLDTHSQLAVSALRGLIARLRANYEARVKVGRPISDRNRNRITSNLDQIEESVSDLRQLLQDTQPMATEAQKLAAKFQTLRNRWRAKQLGVATNG